MLTKDTSGMFRVAWRDARSRKFLGLFKGLPEGRAASRPNCIHVYLVPGSECRPGDGSRALCGYVKDAPATFQSAADAVTSSTPLCEECWNLAAQLRPPVEP